MSREGKVLGHACSQTLFGSLKVVRRHSAEFKNRRGTKNATLDWLLW